MTFWTRTKRCTSVLALALGLAPSVADAQATRHSPAPIGGRMQALHAEIPALLKSDDAIDQAWGAWIAGRDQLTQAVPLLEWLVARQLVNPGDEADYALAYSLDALIQLDASPPSELLHRISARRPVEALFLASGGNAEMDGVLLSMLGEHDGLIWFGAANLLLARGSPRLAAGLLAGLHLSGTLRITDGSAGFVAGSASGFTCCMGGIGAPRTDLPPRIAYVLRAGHAAGQQLLADGPTPVYYERLVGDRIATPCAPRSEHGGGTPTDRLRYLAALMPRTPLPIAAAESRDMRWHPGLDVAAATLAFRLDLEARYARMIDGLAFGGFLLGADRGALAPDVRIDVVDARSRQP
jgi:hypothetical protein